MQRKIFSNLKCFFLITRAFLLNVTLQTPHNIPPIWGGLLSNIIHENASVIRKTPFNYTHRSQKTKDFVKLKMRFSNYRSIFMVNVAYQTPPNRGSIMGGLLSNIFDKNACVIRKTRFKKCRKFPLYFQRFSFINTKVQICEGRSPKMNCCHKTKCF